MATFAPNERQLSPAELAAYQASKNPGAPSLADMYRDILPAAAPTGGLTNNKVHTVPIDEATGMPTSAGGTTYFPKGPNYGYNAVTGDYEVQQPSNAYVAGGRPNYDYAPGMQAIENAAPNLASMFGSSFRGGWGSEGYALPGMYQTEANGMPIDNGRPLNLPGGGGGRPSAPTAAAPPPKTPMQSLADMFTPAKVNPNITYDQNAPRQGGHTSTGEDNSFMPRSVQMSSRWNIGY